MNKVQFLIERRATNITAVDIEYISRVIDAANRHTRHTDTTNEIKGNTYQHVQDKAGGTRHDHTAAIAYCVTVVEDRLRYCKTRETVVLHAHRGSTTGS